MAAEEQPTVWATFLAQLWVWVAEHGDALVPTTATTTVNGARYHLGPRVKNARVYYRRGSLSRRQIEQLEALPGWSWNGHRAHSADTWRSRVASVRRYGAAHGSLGDLRQADASLARWLEEQRRNTDLSPAQHAELAELVRAFEPPDRVDVFIDTVTAWIARVPGRDAGHLLRSTRVTVAGKPVRLGSRAAVWRARHDRGALSARDVARLEAIPGWDWGPRPLGRRPKIIEQLSKD